MRRSRSASVISLDGKSLSPISIGDFEESSSKKSSWNMDVRPKDVDERRFNRVRSRSRSRGHDRCRRARSRSSGRSRDDGGRKRNYSPVRNSHGRDRSRDRDRSQEARSSRKRSSERSVIISDKNDKPNKHKINIVIPPKPPIISRQTDSPPVAAQDDSADRIGRLEKMVALLVNSQVKAQTSYDTKQESSSTSTSVQEFIPRNTNFTMSMWINKLQEECITRNFDEQTTIQFMASNMSGIVKAWFKTISSFDYTWPEMKLLLIKTFPDNTDFAITLRMLVNRVKQPDESMMNYYFSKMYLIEACKITGENAVSCLIDGLNNPFIQAEAKSQNFSTPESLYSQFLSKLPNYEPQVNFVPQNDLREVLQHQQYVEQPYDPADDLTDVSFVTEQPEVDSKNKKIRCFNCDKRGHTAANCFLSPICYVCCKSGHISSSCRKNKNKPPQK